MSLAAFRRSVSGDPLLRDALVFESTFPSIPARMRQPERSLPLCISDSLCSLGVHGLYSHQGESLEIVRSGADVVVVTPTASGKSLAYVLPILERIYSEPDASALVMFPLKALERDQLRKLTEWQRLLGDQLPFSVSIFDGDTPAKERAKIKKRPPNLLITNPDMLHQGMLAYHQGWETFLKRLRYIVIDELHAYRGVFGSHFLQVLRRMSRLLHYYGCRPQFICLSATIGNPAEFANELIGRSLQVVTESGAPQAERDFLLVNAPDQSTTTTVLKLLTHALDSGLKTIVFTKARVATEVLYRSLNESRPDLARKVSSYRAGFLPEERRDIEAKLASA
ncbi:DEAD/DEAH box helicase, partial [bacterium]|nr:DEAD/DEAH box helicase [bacterium]